MQLVYSRTSLISFSMSTFSIFIVVQSSREEEYSAQKHHNWVKILVQQTERSISICAKDFTTKRYPTSVVMTATNVYIGAVILQATAPRN